MFCNSINCGSYLKDNNVKYLTIKETGYKIPLCVEHYNVMVQYIKEGYINSGTKIKLNDTYEYK